MVTLEKDMEGPFITVIPTHWCRGKGAEQKRRVAVNVSKEIDEVARFPSLSRLFTDCGNAIIVESEVAALEIFLHFSRKEYALKMVTAGKFFLQSSVCIRLDNIVSHHEDGFISAERQGREECATHSVVLPLHYRCYCGRKPPHPFLIALSNDADDVVAAPAPQSAYLMFEEHFSGNREAELVCYGPEAP